jgi:hypothetical protein
LLPCLDSVNTRLLPFGCQLGDEAIPSKRGISPNGKHLALVHLIDNDYRIAMLNIESKENNMALVPLFSFITF